MAVEGKPRLLAVMELGGCADLVPAAQAAGFEVTPCPTMRKALNLLGKVKPDVVAAEFLYGPVYGSRISNFETLMAGMQRHVPDAKLIALLERADAAHLDQLAERFAVFERVYLPADRAVLVTKLAETLRTARAPSD
ncbi:MAG TPA: hypothetical protein VKA50_07410 [Gammaproteobacteria bacterium]|nr:hypothetical protein [Gammaproteobacteria bacterium]